MRITFDKLESNLNRVSSKPLAGLAVAALLFGAACGGGTSSTPGTGGSATPGTGGNGTGGGNGGNSSAGNSGGGTTGTGGSAAGNSGSAGNGPAGSSGGNSVGTGGNSTAGSGGGTAGSSGGNVGSGGNATGGAQAGRGGNSAGAGGASAGTGGTTGTAGNTGSGGTTTGCPTNATFCSGFESTDMPPGSIYMANAGPGSWTRDFEVDTSQHHSGASSLRVKSNGESTATNAYQMLAVPATPSAFWVRFWIQSSMPIGQANHNAYAAASIGSGTNDLMIEFADDTGLSFNTKDSDCFPTVGCTGQHPTTWSMLPAMTWECIEISFDGTNRVQQLYVNGSLTINAPNYPSAAMALPYFKFGFDAYHGPQRQIWYDDVAVAPTRIGGCN